MQKSKIVFIATLTASVVGFVNILGSVIAYSLVMPETNDNNQALIADNSSAVGVPALPTPAQNLSADTASNLEPANGVVTDTGAKVAFRVSNQKLVPGQTPSPTGVATNPSGTQVFKWCSGVNPDLPDEVCQAIVSIASNPVESNPHLGQKARQSLALLPRDTTLAMDENTWQASGAINGSIIINADTSAYGTVKIKIFLEKQNNIWVLVDGQLA